MDFLQTNEKYAIDAASLLLGLGTLVGWLPSIAAGLTVVWTLIRIYETETVQCFIKRIRYGKDTFCG